ncbi:CPBP family intramembrane metalloprotease domain-containing protein [Janthinobacterium sp. BJB412]|nr:CPBP family intramembrane metalloprotease domain-containing protein [Janthinobacterium sp. BJB412]
MTAPPSNGRAMWLLARLRLRRLLNQAAGAFAGKAKAAAPGARKATPAKRRGQWLLTLIVALAMSFSFLQMARTTVVTLHCKLDAASACQPRGADDGARFDMAAAEHAMTQAPPSPALARALTMNLSLLFMVSILLPLGSRELAQPDWDLEWLVTLPLRRGPLLWGRVLERSLTNPAGILALWPALGMLAWFAGYRWSAPLLSLAATALLLSLAALLRTIADTGLRMALPAAQLRNLQALCGLAGLPFMYLAMSFSLPQASGFTLDWARAFPAWPGWTPPGLALRALAAPTPALAAQGWALLLAATAALLWAGVALLRWQLRDGVVAAGSRERARPRAAASARVAAPAETATRPAANSAAGPGAHTATDSMAGRAASPPRGGGLRGALRRLLASPVKRRELRLLSRDTAFLTQSLLLPVVIIGSQLVFNGGLDSIPELGKHPTLLAAMAFGVGAYVLMLSAFQTLNNEGQVLWLLYTFPRRIDSVLMEKAQLWGALALVYPLALFGLGAWLSPRLDWQLLVLLAIVVAGVPIYSLIAVSLGVFACDPQATDIRHRVRPTYVYLYMLLTSFYLYAIYTELWAQKLVVIVLSGALALALWQKARDELPYLLDPAAAPPARVAAADGLIAATLFFVLQGVASYALADDIGHVDLATLVQAFAIAGAAVYLLTRLVYWRSKTGGQPPLLRGARPAEVLAWGVGLGLLAAVAGLGYLYWLLNDPLPALAQTVRQMAQQTAQQRGWMLLLGVLAAPLCEEFIFRGLIFGGLRRSMAPLPAAVASAAVFAIVHPPLSMLPVFALGLCAALAYHRSKVLLAPMLVHAIYNGLVLGYQFWR